MKVCLFCGERFSAEDWRCPSCTAYPEAVDGLLSFAPDLAARNDGFCAESFEKLFKLEAANFWFRSRNHLLIWALRRFYPQAGSFIEIGCGTGYVLSGIHREFPTLRLCGSDISSHGLSFAEQRLSDVTFFQMDARRIPFEAEFDVLGGFDVLEHIAEDDVVLSQMFQAIKPGGGIMLTVPQHRFLWSYKDEYSCHKRRYTRKELVGKVKQAGFEIVRATSFVSLLLVPMLLSRMRQRRPQGNWDATAELRIGGFLNTLLEKVLGLERILIRCGLSFPAGGSLLVIAKRNQE